MARQQQELKVEIPAPRGAIFDRTGQPLAMSVPMESVFVNPLRVPDMGVASEILARILNWTPEICIIACARPTITIADSCG